MLIVNVSEKDVQVTIKKYGLVKIEPRGYHQIRDTFYINEIRRIVSIFGDSILKIMSEAEYDDWLDDVKGVGDSDKEAIVEELQEVIDEIVSNPEIPLQLNNEVLGDLSREQINSILSSDIEDDDFEFPELDDPNISSDDFYSEDEVETQYNLEDSETSGTTEEVGVEEITESDERHPFLVKLDTIINHDKLDDKAKLKAVKKIAENLDIKFDGRATLNSLVKEIEKEFNEE